MLYALPRPEFTLREFARLLKPGGRLIVANPREKVSLWQLVSSHLRSGQGLTHSLRCLGLAFPLTLLTLFDLVLLREKSQGTLHFVDQDQLESWFRNAGLKVSWVQETYAGQDLLMVGTRS